MEDILAYYNTPIDIAFYFRDKESITRLLDFFIEEAEEFSDIIDSHGFQIPYPIIHSERGFVFQVDYQFYLHTLAKFVSNETKDKRNYWRVLNGFAITKGNLHSHSPAHKNRLLLTNLHESQNKVFDINRINSYTESLVNGYLKGLYLRYFGKEKVGITRYDLMEHFTPVLYRYNGMYVEYKAMNLIFSDVFFPEYREGIQFYIGDKWEYIKKRYALAMKHNKMEQVQFGSYNIDRFLSQKRYKKMNYFHIDINHIKETNEYIDYYKFSQLSEVFEYFDEEIED